MKILLSENTHTQKEIETLENDNENKTDSYYQFFVSEFHELIYDFKLNYRFLKRYIRKFINEKTNKNFTNIVYLTTDCPMYMPKSERLDSPIDFISKMRKQYPDNNICLLIPIIALSENTKISKKMTVDFEDNFFDLERTSINFDFFAQNTTYECSLYKFAKNEANILIYGIFSPAFSYLKNPDSLKSFDKMSMFMRAARTVIKNLYKDGFKPDIIQSEFVPFFLGSEFEPRFPGNIKVFQIFDNFSESQTLMQEPFLSIVTLADKTNIAKLCADAYIQNCFARLLNLPPKIISSKKHEFLNIVCNNYKMFLNTEHDENRNKESIIFKHLNDRTRKLFPNIIKKNEEYYCPLNGTITNCDSWAVYSETYYKELYEKKLATSSVMKEIKRTTEKSCFIEPAINIEKYNARLKTKIYNEFNNENYREERIKNKKNLVKEFSSDSLKTNFIDKTLFKNADTVKIFGYLDSFYDAPLLFANPDTNIYTEGTDILFNTIMKLFERNRNIQIIISAKDGLKQNYIKSSIDFLNNNRIFMGRWVYIDGSVNLPKMFSAADMNLYPARICNKSIKHLLGLSYGCIPIVSNAGILNDTVTDIYDNISEGNGFKLKQDLLYEDENTNIYINYLEKALEIYNNNHSSWNIIVRNALATEIDWNFDKLEHFNQIYTNIL